jgi:hypothetical protein
MVLQLARVKNYLRIDSTITEDDSELESMINGAQDYFENETNVILSQRQKTYKGYARIYDFPIDDVSDLKEMPNYYINESDDAVTLTIGYELPTSIPNDIQQCLLQIIKVWYYESENEVNQSLMPMSVKQVISKYRRFWL